MSPLTQFVMWAATWTLGLTTLFVLFNILWAIRAQTEVLRRK